MDREAFDAVARLFASSGTRRATLSALFGVGFLAQQGAPLQAKRRKRRRKRGGRGNTGNGGGGGGNDGGACYPGDKCTPGHGTTNAGCDFSNSIVFRELNANGAILADANFTLADASGADFRGAILSDACFAGASLRDAIIDNSTVLGDAIFCNTLMPDGSINDSDCGRGTACCPTDDVGEGEDGECATVLVSAGCKRLLGEKWVCPHLTKLGKAQLSGCDLTNAILGFGTDMSEAHLVNTILTGADMRFLNLTEANLNGATMTGAWLRGADLTDVQWDDTTCPDGTNSDNTGPQPSIVTCCGHLLGQEPSKGC